MRVGELRQWLPKDGYPQVPFRVVNVGGVMMDAVIEFIDQDIIHYVDPTNLVLRSVKIMDLEEELSKL